MELALPLVALGGLYVIKNNKSPNNSKEGMENMKNIKDQKFQEQISNINNLNNNKVDKNIIDNQYYSNDSYLEEIQTKYNGGQTTDQFFNSTNLIKSVDIDNNKYDLSQQFDLTGEKININNFNHNNMQPFYRSKTMHDMNHDKTQSILDNKIGDNNNSIDKRESAPLFEPSENLHYANGMPNMNDFMQSRVVPGNKISNVLPFDQKKVGPGLDQGYRTEGNNGFNSGMVSRDKWLPPTVDQLRIATNPKVSYSLDGHTGPASSHIKNRGIQASVEKNKPDTFFEMGGKSRFFTTTGVEKGQTNRSMATVYSDKKENTSSSYEGIAAGPNMSNIGQSSYEASKRNVYGSENFGIADAGGEQPAGPDNYGAKSYNIYENNRTANSNIGKYGGVGGALGAVIAPVMDLLRPSRKENVIGNVRLYGDVQSSVPSSYVANSNDVLRTTNRQMTRDDDMFWNVQGQNIGTYTTNSQKLSGNQRDTTQHTYIGNAGGNGVSNNMTLYDAAYKQTNNATKEILSKNRTNQGGTQLYNQNLNVSIAKKEQDRDNNRMWVPSSASAIPPSQQTYGKLDQPYAYLEEKTNIDRINPDLLSAFKKNPYTQPLNSVS